MAYITCDEDYCNLPCFNTFELVGQNEKKQTCLKTQSPQVPCGEHGQRWPQLSHLCFFQSLVSLGHIPPCDRPKKMYVTPLAPLIKASDGRLSGFFYQRGMNSQSITAEQPTPCKWLHRVPSACITRGA